AFRSAERPPTGPSPLSLHDALPISARRRRRGLRLAAVLGRGLAARGPGGGGHPPGSEAGQGAGAGTGRGDRPDGRPAAVRVAGGDRKSTRLNSSHVKISYAVFCLKK